MSGTKELIINIPAKPFFKRLNNSMRTMTIFVILLTLTMYANSKLSGLLIGLTIFIFYLIEHLKWCRYYITKVTLTTDNNVKIAYHDKDSYNEYSSLLSRLTIEKKKVWYKIRGQVNYIVIQNLTDNFMIKQYVVCDWDEQKFDDLKKCLQRR
jgi:hypothetical protein